MNFFSDPFMLSKNHSRRSREWFLDMEEFSADDPDLARAMYMSLSEDARNQVAETLKLRRKEREHRARTKRETEREARRNCEHYVGPIIAVCGLLILTMAACLMIAGMLWRFYGSVLFICGIGTLFFAGSIYFDIAY
jgi:hypothetical protein